MAEIMKVFREEVPAMRFIGKKYHDYSGWGEWFANGWFETIENSMGGTDRILGIWGTAERMSVWNAGRTVICKNTGSACLHPKIRLSRKGLRISTFRSQALEPAGSTERKRRCTALWGIAGNPSAMQAWKSRLTTTALRCPLRTACVPASQRPMKREILSWITAIS